MKHSDSDYVSGDDYVVEFLDYRYSFSQVDFEQRVTAAARRLELIGETDLSAAETTDLVALVAAGRLPEPCSPLGRYLVEHLPAIDALHPEPISYWLRKLVFRGGWLDHRVKAGVLDISFDEQSGSFGYRMPTDTSPLVELAPVPSWAELRYSE